MEETDWIWIIFHVHFRRMAIKVGEAITGSPNRPTGLKLDIRYGKGCRTQVRFALNFVNICFFYSL